MLKKAESVLHNQNSWWHYGLRYTAKIMVNLVILSELL